MLPMKKRFVPRHRIFWIPLILRGGGTIEKVWDMARYVVAFEQWVKDEKIAFVASHYDGFAKGVAGKLDSMLIPAFSMLIKQGHCLRG